MFQSIGIIIASVVIKVWPSAKIVDPICTFIFSVIVLITTIPILIDVCKVFMESTPKDIKVHEVYKSLSKVEGVIEVHDLHIWNLNMSHKSMSVHLKSKDPNYSLKRATRLMNLKYKILHTTIQVEHTNDEEDFHCEVYH